MSSKKTWTRNRILAVVLFTIAACGGKACSGCRGCGGKENCDDCVQSCVETQGVSPDVCRGTACASLPADPKAKLPECRR